MQEFLPEGFHPSLRGAPEMIAEALRDAIAGGRLSPGERLHQEQLAAALGVSRIPLREALRQLEGEGLVRTAPNRGAVVASLSWRQAREIGEMRQALEGLALDLALPKMSREALARAEACLEEAAASDDAMRWSALNWTFHRELYAAAERPMLLDAIERLHRNVNRYMRVVLGDLGHQGASAAEHAALLAACRADDRATAADLLSRHIAAASEMLIAHLKQTGGTVAREPQLGEQNR